MTEQRKEHNILFGILSGILIAFVVQILGSFIYAEIKNLDLAIPNIVQGLFATDLAYCLIIFIYLYRPENGKHFLKIFAEKVSMHKTSIKNAFIMFWLAILMYVFTSVLQTGLLHLLPTHDTANNTSMALLSKDLGWWAPLITYVMPLIIAPIFEETIFRGIIGRVFNIFNGSKVNKTIYLIIESIAFGAMHIQLTGSTFSMVSAVTMPLVSGFILGCIYIKTKNLTNVIIAHGSYNFITMGLQLLLSIF